MCKLENTKERRYEVREMTRKELDIAIRWAADEGWNPGLYDGDSFYNTDPRGFFMGFLDGEPIASIFAIAYSNESGFIGSYIVKPEYRNNGYGIKICEKAAEYLKTQNIGIDAVLDQQENYKKYGFKIAYRNIRYESKSSKYAISYQNIVNLEKVNFEYLIDYDSKVFGASRKRFIIEWIKLPESVGLSYIEKDDIKGYGIIRKCYIGYRIGPLFADDVTIAEHIFLGLINSITSDSQVYIDIPEVNFKAMGIIRKYNMKKVFETARMYNKQQGNVDMNKMFGNTTLELG